MTRTINLLSPEALERLRREMGPDGLDVSMSVEEAEDFMFERFLEADAKRTASAKATLDPEPLPGVAGWEGAPLSATVDCGTCQHRVAFGECCPRCDANCSLPASPGGKP